MNRTSDITSFTECRRNLRARLDQVRSTGRPLYVTNRGETDAVILSPKTFDELAEKADLLESLQALDRGIEEMKAGRAESLETAVRGIADELGLDLRPDGDR
jgi:prevent-host-death family protein